jgi:tetratricopeptide (TPR) repeat protein
MVEHFPVGGSGFGPPAMGRTDQDGADGPEDDQAQGGDRAGIDATADEAPEDGGDEERIWDLDAEEEALRTDPAVVESSGGSVGSDGMGAGLSWLISSGPAEPMPGASGPSVTPHPDSAWGEAPDSGERSAELDPEEISWPSGVTLRSLVDRAEAAYGSGQWAEARGLYDRAAHEVPLEPMVLRRLVEIARKLEDSAAEVHYLEQLGDAWIEAGVMEEALEAFLEVLRIDPDRCTARRRLSRFQEMGVPGAERIPEATRESVQGVLESSGARTSVRDDPVSAIQSDEWIDLGALIEEFRDGIKNQIAGDDAPGHYDLAVSHHGMELFEEAVEELDAVLACPGLAVEMELHARELRGVCLLALGRHREAVHEFRTALERPVPDTESRCSILYHLGVALESAEEWREAAEIFDRVRDELPGFLDAEARQSACEMRANGIDPGACAA